VPVSPGVLNPTTNPVTPPPGAKPVSAKYADNVAVPDEILVAVIFVVFKHPGPLIPKQLGELLPPVVTVKLKPSKVTPAMVIAPGLMFESVAGKTAAPHAGPEQVTAPLSITKSVLVPLTSSSDAVANAVLPPTVNAIKAKIAFGNTFIISLLDM